MPEETRPGEVLTDCEPGEEPRDALCARIPVYEDRDRAAGRVIDLSVVVYPALDRDPQPDPVFFLAGGPGQGAARASSALASAFRDVRRNRDLVFVDQRGTGESNGLDCEMDWDDLRTQFSDEAHLEALRRCQDEFDADLRHYTTPVAMDDLDEVRERLGYGRINLWGGSYGTRAALIYVRRHGERVRSAVFDGAVPMAMALPLAMAEDAQRALEMTVAACQLEDPCRARFPNLARDLEDLLGRLRRKAPVVRAVHPRTGEAAELEMRADVVASILRVALYSPSGASMVPLLVSQAARGRFEGLLATALSAESAPEQARMSPGMFFSVICSEDLPWAEPEARRRRAAGTFVGESFAEEWDEACETWPRGDVGSDYREPVRSDVPALVLSGELDPVTPPRWGAALAEGFPNALHVVVPGTAHGTSAEGCVPDLIARFYRNGSPDGLDADCVQDLQRPAFFVSNAGPRMGRSR